MTVEWRPLASVWKGLAAVVARAAERLAIEQNEKSATGSTSAALGEGDGGTLAAPE